MIVEGCRSASSSARLLFPAAVGPQTTRMSAPPEASLNLVPGQLHDRRAAMDVVRRQRRIAQRDEQRAHLTRRQRVAGFDGRLARHRRCEPLMTRMCARLAITGERCERLAQTLLRIETRMRHRHGTNEQRVSAKAFDLEAEALEHLAMALERLGLVRPEMQRHREQKTL